MTFLRIPLLKLTLVYILVCLCGVFTLAAPTYNGSRRLDIVIMTYKRPEGIERLLNYIKELNTPPELIRVHIAQSSKGTNEPYFQDVASLVSKYNNTFGTIYHHITHIANVYQDVSRNFDRYGSKLNSLENLANGLSYAFDGVPFVERSDSNLKGDDSSEAFTQQSAASGSSSGPYSSDLPSEVIVLEDDINLSDDVFNFFGFAAGVMDTDHSVEFATSKIIIRPSILVGHRDVTAIKLFSSPDEESAAIVDRVPFTPRLTFKTFAWMLNRSGWNSLRTMFEFITAARYSAIPNTASATKNLSMSETIFRTRHAVLSGCLWCQDYCYDHVIEWIIQGRTVLAPRVVRATQVPGEGMTSELNVIDKIWNGTAVRLDEFKIHTAKFYLLKLFPGAGIAGIPSHPSEADRSAGRVRFCSPESEVFSPTECVAVDFPTASPLLPLVHLIQRFFVDFTIGPDLLLKLEIVWVFLNEPVLIFAFILLSGVALFALLVSINEASRVVRNDKLKIS